MVDTSRPYPIQLGSMNSGRNAMDAIMDDLRIARVARYDSDFVPPDPRLDQDRETTLLLDFEGTLEGHGMSADGHAYSLRARPGQVMRANP